MKTFISFIAVCVMICISLPANAHMRKLNVAEMKATAIQGLQFYVEIESHKNDVVPEEDEQWKKEEQNRIVNAQLVASMLPEDLPACYVKQIQIGSNHPTLRSGKAALHVYSWGPITTKGYISVTRAGTTIFGPATLSASGRIITQVH